MELIFTERLMQGRVAPYISATGHVVEIAGKTVIAMPPGQIDFEMTIDRPTLNVSPAGTNDFRVKLNGEKRNLPTTNPSGLALFPAGSEIFMKGSNPSWELLIEFDAACLSQIAHGEIESDNLSSIDIAMGRDASASMLAQLAIAHLSQPIVDRLYLDGLTTAITACGLGFAAPDQHLPSTRGTDKRIVRALDYIHENLIEGMSVAELAGVACMSPSWFSRAFKVATGMSVHSYVLESRLERARTAIATTNDPIGIIAHACGFSDHSHMTRLFRRRYGFSPVSMRS